VVSAGFLEFGARSPSLDVSSRDDSAPVNVANEGAADEIARESMFAMAGRAARNKYTRLAEERVIATRRCLGNV